MPRRDSAFFMLHKFKFQNSSELINISLRRRLFESHERNCFHAFPRAAARFGLEKKATTSSFQGKYFLKWLMPELVCPIAEGNEKYARFIGSKSIFPVFIFSLLYTFLPVQRVLLIYLFLVLKPSHKRRMKEFSGELQKFALMALCFNDVGRARQ